MDFKNPDHLLETKAELIQSMELFIEGDAEGDDLVAVFFELPNIVEPEVIVNPRINAQVKLDYYAAMYDDELRLKANPAVKIIGISFI